LVNLNKANVVILCSILQLSVSVKLVSNKNKKEANIISGKSERERDLM
jgi:hypothetical protein